MMVVAIVFMFVFVVVALVVVCVFLVLALALALVLVPVLARRRRWRSAADRAGGDGGARDRRPGFREGIATEASTGEGDGRAARIVPRTSSPSSSPLAPPTSTRCCRGVGHRSA